MSGEQIGGIVRAVVAAGAGFFVAKGIGNAELWVAVGGALSTIAVAFWSYKTNKPK